jgi:Na+:H+ antiporter, NhaA family
MDVARHGTTNPLKSDTTAPIVPLVRPFQEFAARESSGGILLLLCTVAALVWVNSPSAASYATVWHTNVGVTFGAFVLHHDLHFWINDGLMGIFFFVVGLEIKRELLVGDLASPRQAALPIAGAIGGVLAPALIFAGFNSGGPGAPGWGVPMATDIAFVIGVMGLLGRRVPLSLKVFLTALAIVDDIIAVLVIALFYTSDISAVALGAAAVCFVMLLGANWLGVRHPLPYAVIGALLWFAVLESGVHATIAGVLLALTIPSRTQLEPTQFLKHSRSVLEYFELAARTERSIINDEQQQIAVEALEDACEKVEPPLQRFQRFLHPWVTFVIMPLFALANAGVPLGGAVVPAFHQQITLGVTLGLLLGKPVGITAACWLAMRLKLASLPPGTTWMQLHSAAWLGGIGFTMSLFIAALAFSDENLLSLAKIGVLGGSLLAGAIGSVLLLRAGRSRKGEPC